MNIGINARLLLNNRLEGIGWHAYEIITRLITLLPGHQFYLFFDRKENIIIPPGDNVHAISLFPPSRHPLLIWVWSEYSLYRACAEYKIDLFYSPEILMPGKLKIPVIITAHDLSPWVLPYSLPWAHRIYYRYLIKKNLPLADHIITVSNFSKSEMVSKCHIPAQKIEVIYNAPRKIFKPLSGLEISHVRNIYTQGYPYFIAVGSIHARKNIEKIIAGFEAFKNLTNPSSRLVLAGRFMGLSGVAKHALAESKYKNDILCTGYVSDDLLASLLGAADALINLSGYEGFGMPIVEAFASGVPVVAANSSCFPEIGQGAALYVNPEQTDQVANAMQRSLKERDEWIERGLTQLKRFDWDDSAAKISDRINSYSHPDG